MGKQADVYNRSKALSSTLDATGAESAKRNLGLGQQFTDYSGDMLKRQYDDFSTGVGLRRNIDKAEGSIDKLNSPDNFKDFYGDVSNTRNYINAIKPGYSDAEQGNIRHAAIAPMAGAYGDAAGQLRNKAAMTGNSAALGANLRRFARDKGAAMSMGAAGAEGGIADARRSDTLAKGQLMPLPGQMELAGQDSQQKAAALRQLPITANMGLMQNYQDQLNSSLNPTQVYSNMFGTATSGQNQADQTQLQASKSPWGDFLRDALLKAVPSTSFKPFG